MTTGTDTRNIKKIVRALLVKHGVVDDKGEPLIQPEIDFVSAWMRYMNEREDGKTPAEVREKITAEFNQVGLSEEGIKRNQLKARMETALGMEVDEGNTNWETVVTFCKVQEHYKGETIEKFMEWCKADPYNSPKKHQIAQNPLLIKKLWGSAFIEKTDINIEPKFKDGSAYV